MSSKPEPGKATPNSKPTPPESVDAQKSVPFPKLVTSEKTEPPPNSSGKITPLPASNQVKQDHKKLHATTTVKSHPTKSLPRASQIWSPIEERKRSRNSATSKKTPQSKKAGKQDGSIKSGKSGTKSSTKSKSKRVTKSISSSGRPAPPKPDIKTNSKLYRYGYYRHFPDPIVKDLVHKTPKNTFDKINPFFNKLLYLSSGYHTMFMSRGNINTTIVVLNLIRCADDADKGDFTVEEISKAVPGGTVKLFLNREKAEISYATPEEAKEAFLKTKLVWLRYLTCLWKKCNEIYVVRVPNGIKTMDIQRKFLNLATIRMVQGRKGRQVAICSFSSKAEADEEYNESDLLQLAPQILSWMSDDVASPKVIRVINLPPDVVEYDLETMFPTSDNVWIELRDKQYRADVQFSNPQLADEAELMNFLIKVGRLKLCWVRKDQLYLSELPKGIKGSEIAKIFPGSTFVKFITKDTGDKIAVLKFKTAEEADIAYEKSKFFHLNRHHLAWKKPKALDEGQPTQSPALISDSLVPPSLKGSQVEPPISSTTSKSSQISEQDRVQKTFIPNEINMEWIPLKVGYDEIMNKFPGAKKARINKFKDHNTAHVVFASQKDALAAFEKSTFAHRGHLRLDWTLPHQLKVILIPFKANTSAIMNSFETSKHVTFLKASRIAVVDFESAKDAQREFLFHHFYHAADRCLSWIPISEAKRIKDREDNSTLPDEQLAKKLWKIPGHDLSNIGSKYSPMIQLSNLPRDTTKTFLEKTFTTAKSVLTKSKSDHTVAVLDFKDVMQAAKAYKKAMNMQFETFVLRVKPLTMRR